MFGNTLGTLSYNDFEFDGSSKLTANVEMVQDEAERTIIYQRQTFTVMATIAENGDIGATMDEIKAKLGEQGKKLIVDTRGFADTLIVGPGGQKDLKWGPVPKILSWEPIGANRAAEIVWEVVVHLPYCDATSHRTSGILAFNYEVDFSIKNGDTQRRISGYFEIAQTRNGRRAPDCADRFANLINPALPPGFEREVQRTISKDKSRCDFTITDTQIASKFPYPVGCTHADGRHRAAWTTSNRGRTMQRNTISMELEMAPGVSQSQAWAIFGNIIQQRINHAKRQGLPVLLDELVVDEDIWGRSTGFSVGYRILRSCAACLPKHAGLWQPINTDWTRWRASMSNVFDVRGTAKLNQAAGDAIIDLCGDVGSSLTVAGTSATPAESAPQYPTVFKNTKPDPKYSYVDYQNAIIPYRERPVQRQAILQSPESPGDLLGSQPESSAPFSFGPSGGTADVIQEGGRGRYDVTMVGTAKRAGYPVPRPSLDSLGNQTATETFFKMAQTIVGNWFGVPIFQAVWQANYALSNSPGNMKQQKNPKEEVDQNGNAICNC